MHSSPIFLPGVYLNGVLLSEGSLVDLDGTLFIQLALFTILFFVLRGFVFKPMLALFEAREQATEGAREEAKRLEREARDQTGGFEERIKAAKATAGAERDKIRAEALRSESSILASVREETQKMLEDAGARVESERTRIQGEMSLAAPKIAREIASKLLGRELS